MAIRLRTVDGIRVALCAARSMPKAGDVYLDDADHYALMIKFGHEWDRFPDAREVPIMEREESDNPNRAWWDARYEGKATTNSERGAWRQARGAVPPRTEGSPEAAIRALREESDEPPVGAWWIGGMWVNRGPWR